MLYNHIYDVKDKLKSRIGIGALSCAKYMLKTIEQMEILLK